jgi:hypothetical protein
MLKQNSDLLCLLLLSSNKPHLRQPIPKYSDKKRIEIVEIWALYQVIFRLNILSIYTEYFCLTI